MSLERVVIWGASGHGRVVLDAAFCSGSSGVIGFLDDNPALASTTFAGKPVLGGRDMLPNLRSQGVTSIHVAIGHCPTRVKIAALARELGFQLHSVVHPRSTIASDVIVGDGTFAAANAVVNAGARIGECVILNTASVVDHDCIVADGVHLAPKACLGGLVQVEREVFVGIGATVLNCLSIGARSIVGGGAVVTRSLPADVVAYGVPARVARKKRSNE